MIESPGSSIYRQTRIGRSGRPFEIFKFRTMYEDSDRRLQEFLRGNEKARKDWERFWKLRNDPRVTKIGSFLRRTSLDELPQLVNVFLGQMSLVGPRPYLPEEVKSLPKEKLVFLRVLPGITGLWQVTGRSDTVFKYRLAIDAWYVRNWTLWLDIVILLKTIKVVAMREGAY
jgi:undecaprenyl-phosphate galactose phosphotransferase